MSLTDKFQFIFRAEAGAVERRHAPVRGQRKRPAGFGGLRAELPRRVISWAGLGAKIGRFSFMPGPSAGQKSRRDAKEHACPIRIIIGPFMERSSEVTRPR